MNWFVKNPWYPVINKKGKVLYSNRDINVTLEWIEHIVHSILNTTLKDIVVWTTGSSWRSEEYSILNDFELLLYAWSEVSSEDMQVFRDSIQSLSWSNCEIIFENKSKYNPEFFEWMVWWKTISPIFFPSRFIDFLQLYGSQSDYDELLSIFIWNIKTTEPKNIWNWKKRITTHRKTSNTWIIKWKWEESKIFDEDKKSLNYSNIQWGCEVSIKIWALRYIQYQIVHIIMSLIRSSKIENNHFKEIGRWVEQKIDFLSEYWLESSFLELQELKGLYWFFLGIHNNVSKKFNKNWKWVIELSDDEFKIFKENLLSFNKLMNQFKLKN